MSMTPSVRFPFPATNDDACAPLESPIAPLRLIHQPQAPGVTRQRYRAHVLVLDDDLAARASIAVFLRRRGFRVWVAGSALEAQAMLAHQLPDVLLLEVNLPLLSGADMLRRLRRQRDTALLPVIIVSAQSTARDIRNGLALGADDYITKPTELSLMEARIMALLRRDARLRLAYGAGEWSEAAYTPSLNE